MARRELVLIGGGVRSGKSAFALRRAARFGDDLVFIATAEALDDEMRERARRHRAERGARFTTVECPRELEGCLRDLDRRGSAQGVVIDCLTLWISNLMVDGASSAEIDARVHQLAEILADVRFPSVIVSNEVGLGIVPDNAMARAFRDITGRAHQTLGHAASELYFGMLGQLVRLKPAPLELVAPGC